MKTVSALLLCLLALPFAVAQDGDGLVVVNGRSISRTRIEKILMDAYGVEIMQQVIVTELARQASREAGLAVTRADVERERKMSLDEIARSAGMDPDEATEENKQKALQQVLDKNGFSMTEYLISLERNAHLRKLVESDFAVDEKTLREEFARTYGEKVRVRHIQVAVRNPGRLNQVSTLVRDPDADFAGIAREMSANVETAGRGGELPPFTFTDDRYDPLFRDAAFSLEVGEISNPFRTGQFYHIVKLEERIPPESVRFEDVRQEVERKMRERTVADRMREMAGKLFQDASIKVLDPKMRTRYRDFLEEAAASAEAP